MLESDEKILFEMTEDGILIARPKGPLGKEDFSQIETMVDPWIKAHGQLRGLVICVSKFPGWKNRDGFIHHIAFIRTHQKKIKRIAIATDGILPKVISHVISCFLKPEIKQFPFDQVTQAIQWVRN